MDETVLAPLNERERKPYVRITIKVEDGAIPDLKKIATAMSKFGEVESVSFDKYYY